MRSLLKRFWKRLKFEQSSQTESLQEPQPLKQTETIAEPALFQISPDLSELEKRYFENLNRFITEFRVDRNAIKEMMIAQQAVISDVVLMKATRESQEFSNKTWKEVFPGTYDYLVKSFRSMGHPLLTEKTLNRKGRGTILARSVEDYGNMSSHETLGTKSFGGVVHTIMLDNLQRLFPATIERVVGEVKDDKVINMLDITAECRTDVKKDGEGLDTFASGQKTISGLSSKLRFFEVSPVSGQGGVSMSIGNQRKEMKAQMVIPSERDVFFASSLGFYFHMEQHIALAKPSEHPLMLEIMREQIDVFKEIILLDKAPAKQFTKTASPQQEGELKTSAPQGKKNEKAPVVEIPRKNAILSGEIARVKDVLESDSSKYKEISEALFGKKFQTVWAHMHGDLAQGNWNWEKGLSDIQKVAQDKIFALDPSDTLVKTLSQSPLLTAGVFGDVEKVQRLHKIAKSHRGGDRLGREFQKVLDATQITRDRVSKVTNGSVRTFSVG